MTLWKPRNYQLLPFEFVQWRKQQSNLPPGIPWNNTDQLWWGRQEGEMWKLFQQKKNVLYGFKCLKMFVKPNFSHFLELVTEIHAGTSGKTREFVHPSFQNCELGHYAWNPCRNQCNGYWLNLVKQHCHPQPYRWKTDGHFRKSYFL